MFLLKAMIIWKTLFLANCTGKPLLIWDLEFTYIKFMTMSDTGLKASLNVRSLGQSSVPTWKQRQTEQNQFKTGNITLVWNDCFYKVQKQPSPHSPELHTLWLMFTGDFFSSCLCLIIMIQKGNEFITAWALALKFQLRGQTHLHSCAVDFV